MSIFSNLASSSHPKTLTRSQLQERKEKFESLSAWIEAAEGHHSQRNYKLAEAEPEVSPELRSSEDSWGPAVATEFLYGGAVYTGQKLIANQLEAQYGTEHFRKAKMNEPALFVQGFGVKPGQFQPIMKHLEKVEENGSAVYVKDGNFYSDVACQEPSSPNSDSKIFRLIQERWASPETVADQMELATKSITELTGDERPDVVAHSMGGLSARIFADRGNQMGKLVMVGTPNHGSRAAMLTKSALKNDVSWAVSLLGMPTAAVPALEWMVPEPNGNEKLAALNSRVSEQKSNTEGMLTVAADHFSSPSPYKGDSELGDGLIPVTSVHLDGVESKDLSGGLTQVHANLIKDVDAFDAYGEYLGWQFT